MWSIIAVIIAVALFAKLSLIFFGRAQDSVREKALALSIDKSAVALSTFAQASRSYAQANGSTSGTTLTVSTLVGASLLPSGFVATNDFGQTLEAKVGSTPSTIVAYWKGSASIDRYGLSSGVGAGYRSVQMRVAQAAIAPLSGVSGALSGIATGATVDAAAPYTKLMLPNATSGMDTGVSGFSLADQNALVYLPD